MDELDDIIREYNENENLFYSCCVEVDEIQDEIRVLERNQNHSQSMQKATTSSYENILFHDNECICSTLKNEILKLQMEMVLKNRKIKVLELQIRSKNFLYQKCKIRLEELSTIYDKKISELKAEIEQLKMAMLRTKAEECEDKMTNAIEQGKPDEEHMSISFKKEIKDEIQEIRNKLLLHLNS